MDCNGIDLCDICYFFFFLNKKLLIFIKLMEVLRWLHVPYFELMPTTHV